MNWTAMVSESGRKEVVSERPDPAPRGGSSIKMFEVEEVPRMADAILPLELPRPEAVVGLTGIMQEGQGEKGFDVGITQGTSRRPLQRASPPAFEERRHHRGDVDAVIGERQHGPAIKLRPGERNGAGSLDGWIR
jgi:hypothetical protein